MCHIFYIYIIKLVINMPLHGCFKYKSGMLGWNMILKIPGVYECFSNHSHPISIFKYRADFYSRKGENFCSLIGEKYKTGIKCYIKNIVVFQNTNFTIRCNGPGFNHINFTFIIITDRNIRIGITAGI